jgi:hypothetical protein
MPSSASLEWAQESTMRVGRPEHTWARELIRDSELKLITVGFELDRIGEMEDRAHGGIIPFSWLELARWTNVNDSGEHS